MENKYLAFDRERYPAPPGHTNTHIWARSRACCAIA